MLLFMQAFHRAGRGKFAAVSVSQGRGTLLFCTPAKKLHQQMIFQAGRRGGGEAGTFSCGCSAGPSPSRRWEEGSPPPSSCDATRGRRVKPAEHHWDDNTTQRQLTAVSLCCWFSSRSQFCQRAPWLRLLQLPSRSAAKQPMQQEQSSDGIPSHPTPPLRWKENITGERKKRGRERGGEKKEREETDCWIYRLIFLACS